MAPPAAVDSEAAAAALATRIAGLESIIQRLKPSLAGTEQRRTLALELLEALTYASTTTGKEQRKLVRAFVDAEGPECIYDVESSMTGNWTIDAKNGTLKTLSSMSRLPGSIGGAVCAYRRVAEKNKLDAAHQLGCSHPSTAAQIQPPPGTVGTVPQPAGQPPQLAQLR